MATVEVATPYLLDRIERDLGLSPTELAEVLAVSPRTLARWRSGETSPQRGAQRHLTELEALADHLQELFMPEAGPLWMRRANRYLGGQTPAEAMRHGHLERVEGALEVIDSGIFT